MRGGIPVSVSVVQYVYVCTYMYNISHLVVTAGCDTFLFRVLEVGWFPGGLGRGIVA